MVGMPSLFYISALNGVGCEPAEIRIKADPSYIQKCAKDKTEYFWKSVGNNSLSEKVADLGRAVLPYLNIRDYQWNFQVGWLCDTMPQNP